MNKPCSLERATIRINAVPGVRIPFGGITEALGDCDARIGADGRSLEVNLPERGWVNRPLDGQGSWRFGYDNAQINIEICRDDRWESVEEWSDLLSYIS